jgi:hypothetical protein
MSNLLDDMSNDKKRCFLKTNFVCKKCDYETCYKNHYERHILTPKHQKNDKDDDGKCPYYCICGKKYNFRQGLHKHKKTCNYIKTDTNDSIKLLTNVIIDVVKNNQELCNHNKELSNQNMEITNKFIDMCKSNMANNTIANNSHNTNNSHNKTFNLQFFLNETCKDAMNINDFVDSLNLQLSDLESVGSLGFVEGISNIIVKNLKAMDAHKRPVHCSDSKREVMYVKDEDKWEKENEEKKKIRKMIKRVINKNANLLQDFKAKHPDCIKSTSKYTDQYNKLIIESMGGTGDNDLEKENKIIKNISKEVTINKF